MLQAHLWLRAGPALCLSALRYRCAQGTGPLPVSVQQPSGVLREPHAQHAL